MSGGEPAPADRMHLGDAGGWGLIGLLIHIGIVGILLASGVTPAGFVHFGEGAPASTLARRVLGPSTPVSGGGGDGVPFWVLARDPTISHVEPYLDRPAYRADRIGYPLAAAPWKLGGEGALLWGLIVTNLAAAFIGTFAAAAIAIGLGADGRASLAFALCPGVTAATWLDVSDGLALALVLVTVLVVQRRKWALAVLAATAAVLTKEVSLVPIGGAFLLWGSGTRLWRRMAYLAVPACVLGAWALYVRFRVGWPPQEATDIVWPLRGYLSVLRHDRRYGTDMSSNVIAVILLGVAVLAIGLWLRRRTLVSSAAVVMAALTFCFGPFVVGRSVNSLRAAAPLLTLVGLDLYGREAQKRRAPART